MSDLIVNGENCISGRIKVSGNKNAVLPMLCASLLTDQPVTLENVPDISDVAKILSYFASQGSKIERNLAAQTLIIQHDLERFAATSTELPVGMRAAVLLLAPVIARAGELQLDTEAKGCALGVREIDPHLDILERFGNSIINRHPYGIKRADTLHAQHIWADYASVTATETFLMMAAMAQGTSVLTNAASEPHVQALCDMLVAMGVEISGIGTSRLQITGSPELSGATVRIPDDHHEVATLLALGGVTGGRVTIETDILPHMPLIFRQFEKLGMQFEVGKNEVTVIGWTREVTQPYTTEILPKIEAAPWPYFPADLLPQAIGVAVGCRQPVMFWNKVYEGALGWSGELLKFGARVTVSDPHRLIVFGGNSLRPATVESPYIIRVVVGLLLAAVQINGQSCIRNADPIKRAYPNFAEKLALLGADIEWRD